MQALDDPAAEAELESTSDAALTFFASSAARPREIETELGRVFGSDLSRKCKTLQGHVLFSSAAAIETLAQGILALTTVDYVHVLLASSPVDSSSDGPSGLDAIRAASEAVSASHFWRAIELWRAVCRLTGLVSEAETPRASLVFRALGKRGGRGHHFTSDDAKRAAKRGLSSAIGLSGSTSAAHFDVLAQVHRNRFWLGLLVELRASRRQLSSLVRLLRHLRGRVIVRGVHAARKACALAGLALPL